MEIHVYLIHLILYLQLSVNMPDTFVQSIKSKVALRCCLHMQVDGKMYKCICWQNGIMSVIRIWDSTTCCWQTSLQPNNISFVVNVRQFLTGELYDTWSILIRIWRSGETWYWWNTSSPPYFLKRRLVQIVHQIWTFIQQPYDFEQLHWLTNYAILEYTYTDDVKLNVYLRKHIYVDV